MAEILESVLMATVHQVFWVGTNVGYVPKPVGENGEHLSKTRGYDPRRSDLPASLVYGIFTCGKLGRGF